MNQTKFQTLVKWVRENGGYIDSNIYLDNSILRIKCKKTNSHELIAIPKKCIIEGKTWLEQTITLLYQISKGKDSFFFPYIDSLPSLSELQNHPFYVYDEKEIDEINKINKDASFALKKMYIELKILKSQISKLFINQEFQSEEWLKYALLISYQNDLYKSCIPMIDMFKRDLVDFSIEDEIKDNKIVFRNYENLNEYDELTLTYPYFENTFTYISKYRLQLQNIIMIHLNKNFTERQMSLFDGFKYNKNSLYFSSFGIVESTIIKARIIVCRDDEDFGSKNLTKRAIEFLINILKQSLIDEVKSENDKYKIFYDLVLHHNKIVKNSIYTFEQLMKNYS